MLILMRFLSTPVVDSNEFVSSLLDVKGVFNYCWLQTCFVLCCGFNLVLLVLS